MKKSFQIIMIFFVMSAVVLPAKAQQKIKVAGCVRESGSNDPIAGVNVFIKGTTRGVTTDVDGLYTIETAVGEILVFSFLGMISQETVVDESSTTLNISLSEDAQELEEVIVVGYGVQVKQSVVGAISQVKSDELMRTGGVTNVSNALTGLVPGLTTLNYSGKPGSDNAEIIIRSKSTWNGSAPLILVDNVERDMNEIDIAEIESISVLKDASATAVFGVRGGNGVILVTTKRGKEGKPVLSVSGNITAKLPSKMPKYLDSYNALWLRNQAIENQLGATPGYWNSYIVPTEILRRYRDQTDPEMYPDVDWQSEMLRKVSWSQRYNMDIRGGTHFIKYYALLAYTYDGDILKGRDLGQGYIPHNDYSRYNFRMNLDFQPTKTTTFGVDFDGAQAMERTTNATPAYLWLGVYGKGPDQYPVQYSDGTFANNIAGYNMYNPVEYFNFNGVNKETRTDINTTFSLKQKLDFITTGLNVNGIVNFRNYYVANGPNIGPSRPVTKFIDWQTGTTTWNYPATDKTGFEYVDDPSVISTENILSSGGNPQLYKNLMYQVSVNYSRTFGSHKLTGMGVFKRIETAMGQNFPTYREEWAGRITYDYGGRYLLEGNTAYNGSEKFITGKKFGFFPSAAIGWVVSRESFFKKFHMEDYFDLLKFRYSWGKVGSDNNIPKWLYITQWSSVTNSAWLGYPTQVHPVYPGYSISNIGNPEARWETAVKNDFAVEAGFFKNRLNIVFDYYWGRRYDIFMNAAQRNIPPWFGADPIPANIGRTSEKGWELETGWNGKTDYNMKYYASAMISHATDVIEYMEDPELRPDYLKKAGFPIGQQHAYISSGVITSWDEMYTGVKGTKESSSFIPGMLQMVDYNGDGTVDENDLVPYGYTDHPQYTMSFTLGAEWKGISVMVQFYGVTNSNLAQSAGEFTAPHYYSVVDRSIVGDMWLPQQNPDGVYHAPMYNIGGDVLHSGTYNMVDGTAWRLKTAEISYRLHGKFLNKLFIDHLRIFFNGNNLWLYSHLNEDRETGGTRDNDNVQKYPMLKRFNLGVKIEF
ncbi:MAG: TonB-dependent receptor [Tannerella sp.]|jgi:TonB-linked SusC/RagA family outer membrane protein|nr:TonB-dependent receptor [Tannerella sp.]